MPNDKNISQLISLSLRRKLDKKESAELEQHLDNSKESRNFAELSQLIEKSVAAKQDAEVTEVDEPGAEFSKESKQRLKKCIRAAVEEKKRGSQQGLPGKESSAQPASPTVAATAEKRELISRFNLIRQLEQDSLGKTWLARDEKLDRTITIKELDAIALESPQGWERFQREATITGNLQHPNIVSLYQFGVDRKSGEPFYAMQCVGERTLADAIEEHHDRIESDEPETLSRYRLLMVFLDACQAIAYAHSQGVIHCDMRPKRVALDSFGRVTVLDWSAAKILEDGEVAAKMKSKIGGAQSFLNEMNKDLAETQLYLSPEQAAGNWDEIDEKTDVYGLGVILFSILTGQVQPEGSTSGATDDDAVRQQIAPIDSSLASDYGKSVPNELASICAKAMAREKNFRFDSVQQLADEVELWMAGQGRN